MRRAAIPGTSLALAMAATLLAGCGGSSVKPAIDITGTWSGTLTGDSGPPGYEPVGELDGTFVLTQSGGGVAGTFSASGLGGSVGGGVSGRHVELRVALSGCREALSFAGDAPAGDDRTIDVSYQGTYCDGVGVYGKGTLTRQ